MVIGEDAALFHAEFSAYRLCIQQIYRTLGHGSYIIIHLIVYDEASQVAVIPDTANDAYLIQAIGHIDQIFHRCNIIEFTSFLMLLEYCLQHTLLLHRQAFQSGCQEIHFLHSWTIQPHIRELRKCITPCDYNILITCRRCKGSGTLMGIQNFIILRREIQIGKIKAPSGRILRCHLYPE